MRYLPVFLDLHSGLVLLLGSGELARAKLRVLLSAGARIRWYASAVHDVQGLEPAQLARIEFAKGDPRKPILPASSRSFVQAPAKQAWRCRCAQSPSVCPSM